MNLDDVLRIVKQDLMIKSDVRDDYLKTIIKSCESELNGKGVRINNTVEDTLLLADYSAFRYRHRTDDVPVPQNIQLRIQNKKLWGRLYND